MNARRFCLTPALLLLLAAPAGGQVPRYAVMVGAGETAGIAGVEGIWTSAEHRVGLALGVGMAGFGGRGVLYLGEGTGDGLVRQRPYASVGYLATPWRFGLIHANGAVVVEGGWEIAPEIGWGLTAQVGMGVSVPRGGTWGGNTAGVAARLQLGLTF